MDDLQGDIDALEKEKAEMKKRLDAYSKKTLLADLARHASSSSSIAAVVAGNNKPAIISVTLPRNPLVSYPPLSSVTVYNKGGPGIVIIIYLLMHLPCLSL
jgi:hypothetical protein